MGIYFNKESFLRFKNFAGVAQLVEQGICNAQVAGSSPIASFGNVSVFRRGARAAKGSRL